MMGNEGKQDGLLNVVKERNRTVRDWKIKGAGIMKENEEYTPAAMLVNFKGGGSVPKGESRKESAPNIVQERIEHN